MGWTDSVHENRLQTAVKTEREERRTRRKGLDVIVGPNGSLGSACIATAVVSGMLLWRSFGHLVKKLDISKIPILKNIKLPTKKTPGAANAKLLVNNAPKAPLKIVGKKATPAVAPLAPTQQAQAAAAAAAQARAVDAAAVREPGQTSAPKSAVSTSSAAALPPPPPQKSSSKKKSKKKKK
jgi:hypothetical protein